MHHPRRAAQDRRKDKAPWIDHIHGASAASNKCSRASPTYLATAGSESHPVAAASRTRSHAATRGRLRGMLRVSIVHCCTGGTKAKGRHTALDTTTARTGTTSTAKSSATSASSARIPSVPTIRLRSGLLNTYTMLKVLRNHVEGRDASVVAERERRGVWRGGEQRRSKVLYAM